MSLTPVAPDELATVVTTLEMRTRPAPRSIAPSPLRLAPWPVPDLGRYRALFRRVGAPWLWYSRLAMTDERLAAIVHDPAVAVFAVEDPAGGEVGLLELDYRHPGACELSYVGLIPELAGRGHGGWLLAEALARAWRPGIGRVWVHTCTLDHPAALKAYAKAGFQAVARTIETFPDPRALGMLPADAAPQIPYLASRR